MSISEQEVAVILSDSTKRIVTDIHWRDRSGRYVTQVFRVDVWSEPGWELYIDGFRNPYSGKLTYTLVHGSQNRIVGLCLGFAHNNPVGDPVGETHKHRWTDLYKDAQAYEPSDITADWQDPVQAWREFCAETRIAHEGAMHVPEWQQEQIP